MDKFYITDELRMYRSDERNITLEKLSHGTNPRTKEPTERWSVVGYFRTFRHALERIIERDMLINENQVDDLQSYLNELRRVHESTRELLKENEE